MFVPPSEEEVTTANEPQQSLSGSTFGNAVWGEIKVVAPHGAGRTQSPVVDIVVDAHEDLIWSASSGGHVSALRFPDLSCHCAFSSFRSSEVRALVAADSFVLSLGKGQVRTHSRTGVPKATFNSERQGELFAATQLNAGQVVLGGTSPSIYTYDVEGNKVSMQVGIKSGCSTLKTFRNSVYAGHMDGTASILDPRSFRSTNSITTGFAGGIQAMDVKEKLMCCSGYTLDRGGNSYLEGVVKVFDLRMMRAMQPIAFAPGAFGLKFHPVLSGTMVLMAQSGQLQVCDALGSHSNLQGYHVDTGGGMLYGLDIASSGEVMYVSDSVGFLHQWVDRAQGYRLNVYPKPLEQPYVLNSGGVRISPDNESIPLSMLDPSQGALVRSCKPGDLLSQWPQDLWFKVTSPMDPIPQEYMENLQPARDGDFIMYSRVTKNANLRRYQGKSDQVKYVNLSVLEELDIRSSLEVFASPAKRTPAKAVAEGPSAPVLKPPGLYQQKNISYSRLGVLGFDFEFYNRTTFSGLENTLPYTYMNGALQMLFYLPDFRAKLMSHLCKTDFCLSCELAFLFRILEQSNGVLCQAKNLLRALDHIPLAKEMKLTGWQDKDFTDPRHGLALVEKFVEFVFLQLQLEYNKQASPLNQLSSFTRKLTVKCKTCGNQAFEEEPLSDCLKFVYPEDASIQQTFGSILRESLQHMASKVSASELNVWCNRCGNKQPSQVVETSIKATPELLFIFTGLGENARDSRSMWKSSSVSTAEHAMAQAGGRKKGSTHAGFMDMQEEGEGFVSSDTQSGSQSWVPTSIKINTEDGLFVEEMAHASRSTEDPSSLYTLSSILCHVHDPRHFPGAGHSVLHQKISDVHTKDKNLWAWYLFNDFQVSKTSVKEALAFDAMYKNACVLVYVKSSGTSSDVTNRPEPAPIEWKVFLEPPLNAEKAQKVVHDVQTEDDLPKAGEYIAIDAEFVCVSEEVTRISNQGTPTLVRPMTLSLARVSALRSDGRVLIDDYIEPCCPIRDYLTKYSGLREGDLNPSQSKHAVTKLKSCYLKLLYLVARGCCFVGHGLAKDFRVLNIWVPPANIRDTVDLFHLPRSRKISLRWLASYLLDLDIQVDTHDSIEDASTAMAVFRKYQSMAGMGNFENQLQKMYEVGRNCAWETQRELKQLEQQLFDMLDEEKKNEEEK